MYRSILAVLAVAMASPALFGADGSEAGADVAVDPAIVSMKVNVLKRLSDTKAEIELVCVLQNLGDKTFKSDKAQQWVRLYHRTSNPFVSPEPKGKLLSQQEFTTLKAGQNKIVRYTTTWEVPPPGVGMIAWDRYVFQIDYHHDIRADGNPNNDDANLKNNAKVLQSADIAKKVADALMRSGVAAPLTITYPNGGETVTAGEIIEVRWTTKTPTTTINLSLFRRGKVVVAAEKLYATGTKTGWHASWRVPTTVGPEGDGYRIRLEDPKTGAHDFSDANFSIAAPKRPDLYVAGTAGLVSTSDGRPLEERMWVKIGNKGTAPAMGVSVTIYFWGLTTTDGKTSGKIYHERVMKIDSLKPGAVTTLYPYSATEMSKAPSCWGVKVDPLNRIAELREDNNSTGRLWAVYPDAFYRAYSWEAMP